MFVMSNKKSKYPVLQLDLRLISFISFLSTVIYDQLSLFSFINHKQIKLYYYQNLSLKLLNVIIIIFLVIDCTEFMTSHFLQINF